MGLSIAPRMASAHTISAIPATARTMLKVAKQHDSITLEASPSGGAASEVPSNPHPAGLANAIEVEHIVKKYGDFTAVDDVSFSVNEGEIFGIIGPANAGNITVNAGQQLTMQNSSITTEATQASGGNIMIQAANLVGLERRDGVLAGQPGARQTDGLDGRATRPAGTGPRHR